jgi:HAMP domain-containing protein
MWALARLILGRLRVLRAAAAALSTGDIVSADVPTSYGHELGALGASFRAIVARQRELAGVAEAIAKGDLDQTLTPQSANDRLAHAFCDMVAVLSRFAAAQTEMERAHDAGETDAEIRSPSSRAPTRKWRAP